MRVAEDLLPQVLLLENVAGLSYSGKDEGVKYLFARLKEINRAAGTNYQPHCSVLRMVEYGVPQLRERFFMIADRDGRDFRFPSPTHWHPDSVDGQTELFEKRDLPFTAWDAIGGIDNPIDESLAVKGKWGGLLPSIPEGENYLWHTDRKGGVPIFGWRTRYWGFLLKLAKNRPSWTIQAQPGSAIGPFHWKNRRLSTDELLRLMTFPEISIVGGRTSIQRQLGNAVPSLMAEILGSEIRTQLLGARKRTKYTLLPSRQEPAGPEMVQEVGADYMKLVGVHKPHPGTGKGPMAIKRKAAIR